MQYPNSMVHIFVHSFLQKHFEQLEILMPSLAPIVQLFKESLKPVIVNKNDDTVLSSILHTIDEVPVSSCQKKQTIIEILTTRFHDIDKIIHRLLRASNLEDVSKDVNSINKLIFKTYDELFNQNLPSLK